MGNKNPIDMDKEQTRSNSEGRTRINRRDVLRATTASAGLIGSVSLASGSSIDIERTGEIEYTKKKKQVVRIMASSNIEEPSEGNLITGTGDMMTPNYFVGEGRAFNVFPDNNSLISHSKTITTPDQLVGSSRESINITVPYLKESGFEGYAVETLEIVGENDGHDLVISFDEGEVIVSKNSNEILSVKPEQTNSVDLESKQALTKTYEEREIENTREDGDSTLTRRSPVGEGSTSVTPQITVKNEGEVPVFSKENGIIFTEGMPNARIIVNRAEESDQRNVKQSPKGIITVTGVEQ